MKVQDDDRSDSPRPRNEQNSVEGQHVVFTIVSPSYFSRACVLAEGVKELMPEASFRVVVLHGEFSPEWAQAKLDCGVIHTDVGPTALTLDQIDWEDFDVVAAALSYGILEFATSLKPAVLRNFLKEGASRVTYLDPDIQLFNDFTSQLDDAADVSLTPHFLTEIPDDGLKPSKRDILIAGFYNLGFCSVRPSGLPLLNWWASELQFGAIIDFGAGYFTDQRIMDLAALHATVQVLTDPGMNVAYWNLHERTVMADGANWQVVMNGESTPLYFFHFSGFKLQGTPALSVHATRSVIGSQVPLEFALQYDRLVQAGNQRMGLKPDSDPFVTFIQIPREWKDAIRLEFDLHVKAGLSLAEIHDLFIRSDSMFDGFAEKFNALLEGWTTRPGVNGIPRGVSAFFSRDLITFSLTPWAQVEWARTHLRENIGERGDLEQAILESLKRATLITAPVIVAGYFCYSAAVGANARATVDLFEENDLPVALDIILVNENLTTLKSSYLRRKSYLASRSASLLAFVNAINWSDLMVHQRRIREGQYVEAVWAWELELIPESAVEVAMSGGISRLNAVSQWSAEFISQAVETPVGTLSPFPKIPSASTEGAPFSVTPDNAPYVLATFDAKSLLGRKNPEGVLAAWRQAAPEWPEHYLVLKSTDLYLYAPVELHTLIEQSPRTILLDKRLSDEEYSSLLHGASTYISLHRSEGLGLTMVEAALAGLPVVYTNYSGIAEFFNDSHFPVSFERVKVGESGYDNGPYDDNATWAQPNISEAAQKLSAALKASLDTGINRYVTFREPIEKVVLSRNEGTLEKYHLLAKESQLRSKEELPLPQRGIFDVWPIFDPLAKIALRLYFRLPKRARRHLHLILSSVRST